MASSDAAASNTTASLAATASSTGASGATASANAHNSYGGALTSASAPAGPSAIALANAAVEAVASSPAPLIPIVEGQSATVIRLTPGALNFATGAMSAGTAGGATSLQYSDTAVIDFSAKSLEPVSLDLLGYNVLAVGFTTQEFTVSGSNGFSETKTFTALGDAEKFFTSDILKLGSFNAGSQFVDISYYLTASGAAQGFGFNFNIDPPPGGTAPELSTWAMMLLGFAGLGLVASRRARNTLSGA